MLNTFQWMWRELCAGLNPRWNQLANFQLLLKRCKNLPERPPPHPQFELWVTCVIKIQRTLSKSMTWIFKGHWMGFHFHDISVQFSSVTQLCLILCDPMDCSTPGLPVHHQLSEFTQTHVCWVSDAIQSFHPLSSPSPPAPNPSQYQGLFQWVSSSREVAQVLEFQLQHQSLQWTPATDLL